MQLHAFKDSPKLSDCNLNFNYYSITGKLNYLGQTTHGDILFAIHQIAKYSSDPRKEHGEEIIYWHLGIKFCPDPSKGFECYCNADFSGNFNREHAQIDPTTAISQEVDGSFSMPSVLLLLQGTCMTRTH
ncbi:hypothetical protein ACHAW6_001179 [Cyclotella cf. meneghiniana]